MLRIARAAIPLVFLCFVGCSSLRPQPLVQGGGSNEQLTAIAKVGQLQGRLANAPGGPSAGPPSLSRNPTLANAAAARGQFAATGPRRDPFAERTGGPLTAARAAAKSQNADVVEVEFAPVVASTADTSTRRPVTLSPSSRPDELPAKIRELLDESDDAPVKETTLIGQLDDDVAGTRAVAAFHLGRTDRSSPHVVQAIERRLQVEGDWRVRIFLYESLVRLNPGRAESSIQAIRAGLNDDDESVRSFAALVLTDLSRFAGGL